MICSFQSPGDYVQHIQFTDAENSLHENRSTRREYPLILIVHCLIEDDPNEFFQSVISLCIHFYHSFHLL